MDDSQRPATATERAEDAVHTRAREEQLTRIETKLDEMLLFRDLLLETASPFLTGGKSKVWLALLAKSKGGRTT
jgi:hypothetical protein